MQKKYITRQKTRRDGLVDKLGSSLAKVSIYGSGSWAFSPLPIKCFQMCGCAATGSNAGQRYKPRDSWMTSGRKRSLKYSHFEAYFKILPRNPTTAGKQHCLHENCTNYLCLTSWGSFLKKGRGREVKGGQLSSR